MFGKRLGRKFDLELFLEKNQVIVLAAISVIFFFVVNLVFSYNVSMAEDDSVYILAAKRFLEHKSFPQWHGSLYPIVLSFFIKLKGMDLYFLKVVTVLMMYAQIPFLYLAFRKRIPYTLLFGVLLFISVNIFFTRLASLTYSEGLFMMLQSMSLWAFFLLYDRLSDDIKPIKLWKYWLFLGFSSFLLLQTRNIGWAFVLALIVYWLVSKKFINIAYTIVSLLVFYIPFNWYKISVWGTKKLGFEDQFGSIFLKNPYNPSIGYESFSGFVNRFIENSKFYLSIHLPNIMGFSRDSGSGVITIIIFLLFFFVAYHIFRKRNELAFVVVYLAIGIAATFLSQQVFWSQSRLILVFVPLILLMLLVTLYDYKKVLAYILISVILVFSLRKLYVFGETFRQLASEYKQGNKYAGFTPDWVHYVRLVEKTKYLPDTAQIAVRKPGVAYVYGGGREFFGIYKFKNYNTIEVLNGIKQEGKPIVALELPDILDLKKYFKLNPYYKFLKVFVNSNSTGKRYIVFELPDTTAAVKLEELLDSLGYKYVTSVDDLLEYVEVKNKSDYATYFDSLYYFFDKNSVDYVIVASFRKYPNRKTNETISTIKRYLQVLELKYPGMFQIVDVEGRENDEPAYLFYIDYNVAEKNNNLKP